MAENEVVEPVVDTTSTVETPTADNNGIQTQSDAERNFAELREQKKRLERERDELRKRMEQMEASQQAAPKVPDQPSLADDDLVEWKHVKKEIEGLKRQIDGYQQQTTTSAAEVRLKARYPDFETVVTNDNIARLREQFPEIAQTLASNNDLYSKAASTYDIIKRYGIYHEDTYKGDKNRVEENASKPRPLTSSSGNRSDSPLDNANAFADGLTDDIKQKLYKEMQEAIKRR